MINYIKGSVHQGDTKIISEANIRSPKYMKKTSTELKREVYSSTVIVVIFSILVLIIEKLHDIRFGNNLLDLTLKHRQQYFFKKR